MSAPADWKPPQYKWLLTTRLPNNCHVYTIHDTRAGAVEYADETMDIDPVLWSEDASGHLRFHGTHGYHYEISQEIYHGS